MVPGSTSPVFTPPAVMMASFTGRGPARGMEKAFIVSMSRRRWPLVRAFTGRSGGMSARWQATGTISRGSRPSSML